MMHRFVGWLFITLSTTTFAGGGGIPLMKATVDVTNKASLQRGAKYFMNYCAGCHSLKYLRYSQLAKGLGIMTYENKIDKPLLENNLIFTKAVVGEPVQVAMADEDSREWFGRVPPDLTLIARVRGADWLYTYLKTFYSDPSKPFGTNNWLFPDVGMPNVLAPLQGIQQARYQIKKMTISGTEREEKTIASLITIHDGKVSEHQFDSVVNDIVNFLVFTGEPIQKTRHFIGIFVLIFLFALLPIAYLLKKSYWREVSK